MTLTVHHYYPMGSSNVGDGLVARAMHQAIVRHFGDACFVDMPVNDRYRAGDRALGLRGENLRRTNAEADLVLIGGSNLLEPWSKGRWGVFTDAAAIAELRPPVLLLGMGTGSDFGRRIRRYKEPARTEIRLLHARALASAVRDQVTVARLARIGVQTQCVGCPVTYLTDRPITSGDPHLPLIVSFPPERIVHYPGGRWFMRQAMAYVAWLQAQRVNFLVTLHDREDVQVCQRWLPEGIQPFFTEDLDQMVARFEQSRGVIGFRLHACLLGVGLGKPVIPVGVDWRGIGFQETFGLRAVSIRSWRWGQFSKLRRLTLRLLDQDPQLIAILAAAKAGFHARYEAFLADAAARFRALSPRGADNSPA